MMPRKPKPPSATTRSLARNARAALVLAPVTLDAEHAAKLAVIIARTGETRAEFVRRAIRESK